MSSSISLYPGSSNATPESSRSTSSFNTPPARTMAILRSPTGSKLGDRIDTPASQTDHSRKVSKVSLGSTTTPEQRLDRSTGYPGTHRRHNSSLSFKASRPPYPSTLLQGEIHKPWLQRKNKAARWSKIIFWGLGLLGLALTALSRFLCFLSGRNESLTMQYVSWARGRFLMWVNSAW